MSNKYLSELELYTLINLCVSVYQAQPLGSDANDPLCQDSFNQLLKLAEQYDDDDDKQPAYIVEFVRCFIKDYTGNLFTGQNVDYKTYDNQDILKGWRPYTDNVHLVCDTLGPERVIQSIAPCQCKMIIIDVQRLLNLADPFGEPLAVGYEYAANYTPAAYQCYKAMQDEFQASRPEIRALNV